MSNRHIEQAWEIDLHGSSKPLRITITGLADDEGYCSPSIRLVNASAASINRSKPTDEFDRSNRHIERAWEADLPCTSKLLLIALADLANDEGYCSPSVALLMKRTGLSERAVRSHLKALEEAGHITRQHHTGMVTWYMVHPVASHATEHTTAPDAPQHDESPSTAQDAPQTDVHISTAQDAQLPCMTGTSPLHDAHSSPARHAPESHKYINTQLSNLTTLTLNSPPIVPPKGDFALFWAAYPKKVGKGAAEKAWQRAKGNQHLQTILQALEQQKRSAQWRKDGGAYIPNPATWINQRRWEDELPTEDDSPQEKARTEAWWASEEATLRMASKLGMIARGGESWHEFRERIRAKLEEAMV